LAKKKKKRYRPPGENDTRDPNREENARTPTGGMGIEGYIPSRQKTQNWFEKKN